MLDKQHSNVSQNVDTPGEGNPQNVETGGAKSHDTTSGNGASTEADMFVVATLVANDDNGDTIVDNEIENENTTDQSNNIETAPTNNINQMLSIVRLCDGPSTSTQTQQKSNEFNQIHSAMKYASSTTSNTTTNSSHMRTMSPELMETATIPPPAITNATKEICRNTSAGASTSLIIDADSDQLPYSTCANNNNNEVIYSTQRIRRPTISVKCFSPVLGQREMDNEISPLSPTTTPNYEDNDNAASTEHRNQTQCHNMHSDGSQMQNSTNDRQITFPIPTDVAPTADVGGGGTASPIPVDIIDLSSVTSEVCRVESPANSNSSRATARNASGFAGRRVVGMRHVRRAPKEPEDYVDALFAHIRDTHQRIRQALLHSPLTDVKDNALLKRKMFEVIQLYTRGCKNEFERVGNSLILCRRLKRNIIRLLALFNEICYSSRQDAFYLYHISQLIAVYNSLEIRLSFNMTRLQKCALIHRLAHVINKHLIVNNESLAKENILRMFLHMPDMYSARFILEPLFNTFLPEILTSSSLRDQKELPDKTFVKYIIILQQWKEMLRDTFEQVELINKAQHFMCPSKTLHSNSIYANHLPIIHTRKNAVKDILNNLKFFKDLKNAAICDDTLQDVDDEIIVVIDEDADTPAWDFGATYTAEAKHIRHKKNQSRRLASGNVECVDLTVEEDYYQQSNEEKVEDLTWLTSLKEKACERVIVDESENVICLDSDSDGELFSGSIIDPSESYQDCDAFDTDYTSLDGSSTDDKAASEDETLLRNRITSDGLRTYLAPRSKNQTTTIEVKRMTFTRRPSYLGSPYVRTRDVDGSEGDSAGVSAKISATSNISHDDDSETAWPLILNTFSVRDQKSKHFSKSSRFDTDIAAERYENEDMNEMAEQNSEDGDEENDVDDDQEYHSLPSTASSSRTTMGKVIFSQALPESNRKSRKDDDVFNALKSASDTLADRVYSEKGRAKLESKRVNDDITMPLRTNIEDKTSKPVKKQVKFNDQPIGPTRRMSMNDITKLPIKPAIQLNKQQHYSIQHCSNQHCSNQHFNNQHCNNQHCSNQHFNSQNCFNQHCNTQHYSNQHSYNQHHYYNQQPNLSSSPQPRLTSPTSSNSSATDSHKQMARQGRRCIDNLKIHSKFANVSKCSSATIIDSKCDDIIDGSDKSENTITENQNLTVSTQTFQSKNSPKHGLIDFNKLISKSRESKNKTSSLSKQTTTMCRQKDISSTNYIRNESVKNKHLDDYNVDVVDNNVESNIHMTQYGLGTIENKKKAEIEEQNSNVSTTTGPNIYRAADEHNILHEGAVNNKQMLDIVEGTSLEIYKEENIMSSSDICTSSTTGIILQETDLECNNVYTKLHDSDDDIESGKRRKSVRATRSALLKAETEKVLTRSAKRSKSVDVRENIVEPEIMLESEIVVGSVSKNANKSSVEKTIQDASDHKNMRDNSKLLKENKQNKIAEKESVIKSTNKKTQLLTKQQKKQTESVTKIATEVKQTDSEVSVASEVDQRKFENTLDEQCKMSNIETKASKPMKDMQNKPKVLSKVKTQTIETIEDGSAIEKIAEPLSNKATEEVTKMYAHSVSKKIVANTADISGKAKTETVEPEKKVTSNVLGVILEQPSTVSSIDITLNKKETTSDRDEIAEVKDVTQSQKTSNKTAKSIKQKQSENFSDSSIVTAKPERRSSRVNKVQTSLKLKSKTESNASKNSKTCEELEKPLLSKKATTADKVELPPIETIEEPKIPKNIDTIVESPNLSSYSETSLINNSNKDKLNDILKTENDKHAPKILNEATTSSQIAKSDDKAVKENKMRTRFKQKSKQEIDSFNKQPPLDKVESSTVETVEEKEVSQKMQTIAEQTKSSKELNEIEKTEDGRQISKTVNKSAKNIKSPKDITKSSSSTVKSEQKIVRENKRLTRYKLKSITDTKPYKSEIPLEEEEAALSFKSGTVEDNVQVPITETNTSSDISSVLNKNVEQPFSVSASEISLTNKQTNFNKELNEIAKTEVVSQTLKFQDRANKNAKQTQLDDNSNSSSSLAKSERGTERENKVLTRLKSKTKPETSACKNQRTLKKLEKQSLSKNATAPNELDKEVNETKIEEIAEQSPLVSCSETILDNTQKSTEKELNAIATTEDDIQTSQVLKKATKNITQKRTDNICDFSSLTKKLEQKHTGENKEVTSSKPISEPLIELDEQSLSKNVTVTDTVASIEECKVSKKLESVEVQSSALEKDLINNPEASNKGLGEIATTDCGELSLKLIKINKNNKRKRTDETAISSAAEQTTGEESEATKAKPDNNSAKNQEALNEVENQSFSENTAVSHKVDEHTAEIGEEQNILNAIVEQLPAMSCSEPILLSNPETFDKGLLETETTENDVQISKIINKNSKRKVTGETSSSSNAIAKPKVKSISEIYREVTRLKTKAKAKPENNSSKIQNPLDEMENQLSESTVVSDKIEELKDDMVEEEKIPKKLKNMNVEQPPSSSDTNLFENVDKADKGLLETETTENEVQVSKITNKISKRKVTGETSSCSTAIAKPKEKSIREIYREVTKLKSKAKPENSPCKIQNPLDEVENQLSESTIVSDKIKEHAVDIVEGEKIPKKMKNINVEQPPSSSEANLIGDAEKAGKGVLEVETTENEVQISKITNKNSKRKVTAETSSASDVITKPKEKSIREIYREVTRLKTEAKPENSPSKIQNPLDEVENQLSESTVVSDKVEEHTFDIVKEEKIPKKMKNINVEQLPSSSETNLLKTPEAANRELNEIESTEMDMRKSKKFKKAAKSNREKRQQDDTDNSQSSTAKLKQKHVKENKDGGDLLKSKPGNNSSQNQATLEESEKELCLESAAVFDTVEVNVEENIPKLLHGNVEQAHLESCMETHVSKITETYDKGLLKIGAREHDILASKLFSKTNKISKRRRTDEFPKSSSTKAKTEAKLNRENKELIKLKLKSKLETSPSKRQTQVDKLKNQSSKNTVVPSKADETNQEEISTKVSNEIVELTASCLETNMNNSQKTSDKELIFNKAAKNSKQKPTADISRLSSSTINDEKSTNSNKEEASLEMKKNADTKLINVQTSIDEEEERETTEGTQMFEFGNVMTFHDIAQQADEFTKSNIPIKAIELEPRSAIGSATNTPLYLNAEECIAKDKPIMNEAEVGQTLEGVVHSSEDITANHKSADDNDRSSRKKKEKRKRKKELKEIMYKKFYINDDVYTVCENPSHETPSTSARARIVSCDDSLLNLIKAVEAINLTENDTELLPKQSIVQDKDNTITLDNDESQQVTENSQTVSEIQNETNGTEVSRENPNSMDINDVADDAITGDAIQPQLTLQTSVIENNDTANCEHTSMYFSDDNMPKNNLERLAEAVMLTEAATQQQLNNELTSSELPIGENVSETSSDKPDVVVKAKRVCFASGHEYSNMETTTQALNSSSTEINASSNDSIPASYNDCETNKTASPKHDKGKCLKKRQICENTNNKKVILDSKTSKNVEKNMKKQANSNSTSNLMTISTKTTAGSTKSPAKRRVSTSLHSSFDDFITLLESAKPTKLVKTTTQRKSSRQLQLDITNLAVEKEMSVELPINNDNVTNNAKITENHPDADISDNCTINPPTLKNNITAFLHVNESSMASSDSEVETTKRYSLRGTEQWTVINNTGMRASPPENNTLTDNADIKKSVSNTLTKRCIKIRLARAKIPKSKVEERSSESSSTDEAVKNLEFEFGDVSYRPITRKLSAALNHTLQMETDSSIIDPIEPLYKRGRKSKAKLEKQINDNIPTKRKRLENVDTTLNDKAEVEAGTTNEEECKRRMPAEMKNKNKNSFLEAPQEDTVRKKECSSQSRISSDIKNNKISFLDATAEEKVTRHEECAIESKTQTEIKNINEATFLETSEKGNGQRNCGVIESVLLTEVKKKIKASILEATEEKAVHKECNIDTKIPIDMKSESNDFFLEDPTKQIVHEECTIERQVPNNMKGKNKPEGCAKRTKTEKASILEGVFLRVIPKNKTTNILTKTIDSEKETNKNESVKPLKIDTETVSASGHSVSGEDDIKSDESNSTRTNDTTSQTNTTYTNDITNFEHNMTTENNDDRTVTDTQVQLTEHCSSMPSEKDLKIPTQTDVINCATNSNEDEFFESLSDYEISVVQKFQKTARTSSSINDFDDELFEPISDDEFSFEKNARKTSNNLINPTEDKHVDSAFGEEVSQNSIHPSTISSKLEDVVRASDEDASLQKIIDSESQHNARNIPSDEVYAPQYQDNVQNTSISSTPENENNESVPINFHKNSISPPENSDTSANADITDFTNLSLKLKNYNTENTNSTQSISDTFKTNIQDDNVLNEDNHKTANTNLKDSTVCYSDISSSSSTSSCSCSTTSEGTSETDLCKNEPTSFKVVQSEAQVAELLSNTSTSIQDLSLIYLDHEIMSNDALLSELIMDIVSTPSLEHNYATKPLEKNMRTKGDTNEDDKQIILSETKKVVNENQHNVNTESALHDMNVITKTALSEKQDNTVTESISNIEESGKRTSLKVSIPLTNIKRLEEITKRGCKSWYLTEKPSTSKAAKELLEINTLTFNHLNSKKPTQEQMEEIPFTQGDSRKRNSSPNRSSYSPSPSLLEKKRRKFCVDIEEVISDTTRFSYDEDDIVATQSGSNEIRSGENEFDYCKKAILQENIGDELDGTDPNTKELESGVEEKTDEEPKTKNRVQTDKNETTNVLQETNLNHQTSEDEANKEEHKNEKETANILQETSLNHQTSEYEANKEEHTNEKVVANVLQETNLNYQISEAEANEEGHKNAKETANILQEKNLNHQRTEDEGNEEELQNENEVANVSQETNLNHLTSEDEANEEEHKNAKDTANLLQETNLNIQTTEDEANVEDHINENEVVNVSQETNLNHQASEDEANKEEHENEKEIVMVSQETNLNHQTSEDEANKEEHENEKETANILQENNLNHQTSEVETNTEVNKNEMEKTQCKDETINSTQIIKDIQIEKDIMKDSQSQNSKQLLLFKDELATKVVTQYQSDSQKQKYEKIVDAFETNNEVTPESVQSVNLESIEEQDKCVNLTPSTKVEYHLSNEEATQNCPEPTVENVIVRKDSSEDYNNTDFAPLCEAQKSDIANKNEAINEDVPATVNIDVPTTNKNSYAESAKEDPHGITDFSTAELQQCPIQELNYDDHAGEVTLTNYEDEFFVIDDGFKQSKHSLTPKKYSSTNAFKSSNDGLISAQDTKDDSTDFLGIKNSTETSANSLVKNAVESTSTTYAASLDRDLLKTNEITESTANVTTTSTHAAAQNLSEPSTPPSSTQNELFPNLTDKTTAAAVTTASATTRGFDMPDLDSDFDIVPDTTNRASIADLKQMNELSYVGVETMKHSKLPTTTIPRFKKRYSNTYHAIAKTTSLARNLYDFKRKTVGKTAEALPMNDSGEAQTKMSKPAMQQQAVRNTHCQVDAEEENCLDSAVSSTTTTISPGLATLEEQQTTTDIDTATTTDLTTILNFPEIDTTEEPSSSHCNIDNNSNKVKLLNFNSNDDSVSTTTSTTTTSSISDNSASTSGVNITTSRNTMKNKLTNSPFHYATSTSKLQLKPTRVSTRARAPARIQIVTPQRKHQDNVRKSAVQQKLLDLNVSNNQATTFCSTIEFNNRQIGSTLLHPTSQQNITQHTNLLHFERYIQKLMAFIDVPTIIRSARNLLVDKIALSEAHAAILAQASQYDSDGNEIAQPLLLKDHKDGTVSILYDNDDCIKLTTSLSKMVKKLSLALSILQEQQSPMLSMRARIKTLLKQLTETAETSMVRTIAPPTISSPTSIPTAVVNPTNLTEATTRDIMDLNTLNNVELFNNGGGGGGGGGRQQQQQPQHTFLNNTNATTNMYTNWNDAEDNSNIMTNISNGDLPLENEDQLMDIDPLPLLADDGGASNYEHSLTFDFEDSLTMLSTNEPYENPFEDVLGSTSVTDEESAPYNWIDAEQNSVMLTNWRTDEYNNEENVETNNWQEQNGLNNNTINIMTETTGVDGEVGGDFSSSTVDNLGDADNNTDTNDEQLTIIPPTNMTMLTNTKVNKMPHILNTNLLAANDVNQTLQQQASSSTTNMRISPQSKIHYRNLVVQQQQQQRLQQQQQPTSHITIDNIKNIQLFAQPYTQNSANIGLQQQGNSIRLVLTTPLKHNNTNNTMQRILGATTSSAATATITNHLNAITTLFSGYKITKPPPPLVNKIGIPQLNAPATTAANKQKSTHISRKTMNVPPTPLPPLDTWRHVTDSPESVCSLRSPPPPRLHSTSPESIRSESSLDEIPPEFKDDPKIRKKCQVSMEESEDVIAFKKREKAAFYNDLLEKQREMQRQRALKRQEFQKLAKQKQMEDKRLTAEIAEMKRQRDEMYKESIDVQPNVQEQQTQEQQQPQSSPTLNRKRLLVKERKVKLTTKSKRKKRRNANEEQTGGYINAESEKVLAKNAAENKEVILQAGKVNTETDKAVINSATTFDENLTKPTTRILRRRMSVALVNEEVKASVRSSTAPENNEVKARGRTSTALAGKEVKARGRTSTAAANDEVKARVRSSTPANDEVKAKGRASTTPANDEVKTRVRSSSRRRRLLQPPAEVHTENEKLNLARDHDKQTIDCQKTDATVKTVNSKQFAINTNENSDAATSLKIATEAASKISLSKKPKLSAPTIVARGSRSMTPTLKVYEASSSTTEQLLPLNKGSPFTCPSPRSSRIGITYGPSAASTPTKSTTTRNRVEVRRSMQNPSSNTDFPSNATSWFLNVSPDTLTKTVRVRLKRLQVNMMNSSSHEKENNNRSCRLRSASAIPFMLSEEESQELQPLVVVPAITATQTTQTPIQSNKSGNRKRVELLKQRVRAQLRDMEEYSDYVKEVGQRVLENTTTTVNSNKLNEATETVLTAAETRTRKALRRRPPRKQPLPSKRAKMTEKVNLLEKVQKKKVTFANDDTNNQTTYANNNGEAENSLAANENFSIETQQRHITTCNKAQQDVPVVSLKMDEQTAGNKATAGADVSSGRKLYTFNIDSSNIIEKKLRSRPKHGAIVTQVVDVTPGRLATESLFSDVVLNTAAPTVPIAAAATSIPAVSTVPITEVVNSAVVIEDSTIDTITENVCSLSTTPSVTPSIALCNNDNTDSATQIEPNSLDSNQIEISHEMAAAAESLTMMANKFTKVRTTPGSNASYELQTDNEGGGDALQPVQENMNATKISTETVFSNMPKVDEAPTELNTVNDTESRAIKSPPPAPIIDSDVEAQHQDEQTKPTIETENNGFVRLEDSTSRCSSVHEDSSSSDCLLSQLVNLKKMPKLVAPVHHVVKDSTITLLNFDVTPTLPTYLLSGESRDVPTPAPTPLPTLVGDLSAEMEQKQRRRTPPTLTPKPTLIDAMERERALTPMADASKTTCSEQLNKSISTISTLDYANEFEKAAAKTSPIQEEPTKCAEHSSDPSLSPLPQQQQHFEEPMNCTMSANVLSATSATSDYEVSSTQEPIDASTKRATPIDILADTTKDTAMLLVQNSEIDTTHRLQEKIYPLRKRTRQLSDEFTPREDVKNLPITKAILRQRRPTTTAESADLHVHFTPSTRFPADENNVKTSSSNTTTIGTSANLSIKSGDDGGSAGDGCGDGGGDGSTATTTTEPIVSKEKQTRRHNQKQKSNDSQSPLSARKRKSSSAGELNGNFVYGCSRLQAHTADRSDLDQCVVLPASAVVPPVNFANISHAYASNSYPQIKIFEPPMTQMKEKRARKAAATNATTSDISTGEKTTRRGRPPGSLNKNAKTQNKIESADKLKAKKTEENLSKAKQQRVDKKRANIDNELQPENVNSYEQERHSQSPQIQSPAPSPSPSPTIATKIKKVTIDLHAATLAATASLEHATGRKRK